MSSAVAVFPATSNLRRVGAVFAGLVATFIVTTLADAVLHATGVFPPMDAPPMSDGLFAVALAYRVVFNIGGGYLAARLAPDRPLAHALALGALGTLLGLVGTVAFWDAGPHWYGIAVAVTALPCTYVGGRMGDRS